VKKAFLIGGTIAFFLVLSIPGQNEKTYLSEIKDGVRYVHNKKPVLEKPVAGLAFVRKIGELEPKDPNYLFSRPMSVAEDEKGNIYVLDNKDACVKKFGVDRTFIRRFGRRGQGPGEFQTPMAVGVAPQGRLIVFTLSSDFHVFDLDGNYVDHFRLPRYQGIFPAILDSDKVVAYALDPYGENDRRNKILKIFDFKGQVLREFGEPFLLETARRTWDANFVQISVDDKENIFVAFSSQNRIEKYSRTGQLILSIDRVLPYKIEYRNEQQTFEIMGKAVPAPMTVCTPVVRGIGIDGRGRIWVLTFQKTINQNQLPKDFAMPDYLAFEVYDESGILLSRVPLPKELVVFDSMTIHRDHIFFVDPYDQACLYEYAVIDGRN